MRGNGRRVAGTGQPGRRRPVAGPAVGYGPAMKISRTPWSFALALVVVATLAACGSSGGSDAGSSSSSSSPTSSDTPASAKGKPCVAVSDPLPAGAPEVPVKVGAPPTELVIEDLTPGTGAAATASSTVVADYIGVSCSTGTIFDSSYASGQPATFPLSNVIPGWQQGLPGMKVGGTAPARHPRGAGVRLDAAARFRHRAGRDAVVRRRAARRAGLGARRDELVRAQVHTAFADALRDDAPTDQPAEQRAAEAVGEHRLQRRRDDHHRHEDACRRASGRSRPRGRTR